MKTNLPKFLDNVGVFTYRGNFTGFLNDFVAYGTAYSNLGSIESDISFKPKKDNELKVEGHIRTRNLRVGSIFNTEHLGKLTLNGNIEGTIKDSLYDLTFNGVIDTIDIKNYLYKKMIVKGNLKNKLFNGSLSIDDPNLKLDYSGNLDLSPSLPVFKFDATIAYADLHKLNLMSDTVSKISCFLKANFEGNIIDNMQGQIDIVQLRYKNSKDILFLDKATINNSNLDGSSLLTIKSDWFDARFKGQYNFMYLTNSIIRLQQHYLPSAYFAETKSDAPANNFSYTINVKDALPVTKVFAPDYLFEAPFTLTGFFDETNYSVLLESNIPSVSYSGRKAENINLTFETISNGFIGKINSSNVSFSKNIQLQNLNIESTGMNDKLSVDLSWNNHGNKTTKGKISTQTLFERRDSRFPHIIVDIAPSALYVSDSIWNLNHSTVTIDSSSFDFGGLSMKNTEQNFYLEGKISKNANEKASLELKNIDFSLLEFLMGKSGINGKINGKIDLFDIYRHQKVNLDLVLNDFAFDQYVFGDLGLKSNWNSEIEKLVSNISLKDRDKTLIAGSGLIDPINSSVDMNLSLNKTPIKFLEIFVPFLFYDVTGEVNGNVNVTGKISHMLFNGNLTPETRAGLGIKYMKTHYFFSDPVVLRNDSIQFPTIKIEDDLGNKAILKGSIAHEDFYKNLRYDLNITTDRLLAMNTTMTDNDRFYGTAFASGYLDINGQGSEVYLKGDFRSEKGTSIYIPLERKEEVQKYDFIRFITTQTKVERSFDYKVVTSGLDMNFDIDVTPEAKVQLIFNSQIGDVIKGEGSGNIQVKVDKDYNLKLYGDYVIEKGDYLFTLENIINKHFTINRGGTIKWTGDPYDAQLDITAVYKVKTSLYDLFPGNTQYMDVVRRLPVDCIIKLNESLMKPAIDFKIELPTAEESIKDEFNRLIVTKEDINKQMISLLMLGRFYTPEFYAGKTPPKTGTELVGATASTTASELLSNQLSNWLSQISDEVDIGVNYRPGNEISDDQIELALSTQIFNDRVTIDGNIANNSNISTKNSGEIIGDFDIKVKITDDGRLQFKAFNHSNDNIIYDTAPYTQGIGLTYREEFNTLKELLKKYKEAILKKRKKTVAPKEK
jgi:hypothetical protein